MLEYCSLNNKIIKFSDAHIPLNDLGLLRGFAVFDSLITSGKTPLFLDLHLDRFENSAKLCHLKIPYERQEIQNIIYKLIAKNDTENTGIKLILTGGTSYDGIHLENNPTFLILMQKTPPADQMLYEKGAKMITTEFKRELPRAKTTDYLTRMSLSLELQKQKALEVLYVSNGHILEGATYNFFLIKNNRLITAKDDVLHGTRRKIILELAVKDFKIEERPVKIEELKTADEAFISNTTRKIMPVTQIDNQIIGIGHPGPKTKILMQKLSKKINQEISTQAQIHS